MSKDWIGNKNSIFKTLGASNHTDKERENNDFYATDPIAIDKLLTVETHTIKFGNVLVARSLSNRLRIRLWCFSVI